MVTFTSDYWNFDDSPPGSPKRSTARHSPWAPSMPRGETAAPAPAPWSKGYFAFPPPGAPAIALPPPRSLSPSPSPSPSPPPSLPSPPAAAPPRPDWRARAAAAAAEGERAWVRAGGVLTDAHGRVDRARTAAMRAAFAEEDARAAAAAAWEAYSTRGEAGPLRWEDVPWPTRGATEAWMRKQDFAAATEEDKEKHLGVVLSFAPAAPQRPATPAPTPAMDEEITPAALDAFVFDPRALGLSPSLDTVDVCASKPARHRVRRELLHWHSDKFDLAVLARVPEEGGERERVVEDAGRVWRWLSAQGGRARKDAQ